jgi:hypothetical protein
MPLEFPEELEMPETSLHLRLRTALFLIVDRELHGRAFVGSDQFVYYRATDPKACLSPDVFVRLGGPSELLRTFKIWEHGAPQLAVEILSRSDAPDPDWGEKLQSYRETGIAELVRFDPTDDAVPLRIWDHVDGDMIERDLSDPSAWACRALGAYWCLHRDAELGLMPRLSRDIEGRDLWLTSEEHLAREQAAKDAERAAKEAERAAKEAERAAKEAERAAKEAERFEKESLAARVRELEAELARRG